MTTDLREKIAEVLAGHRLEDAGCSPACECGVSVQCLGSVSQEWAEYERHVAEAILAAIGKVREEWGAELVLPGRPSRSALPCRDREDAIETLRTHKPLAPLTMGRLVRRCVVQTPWLPVDTEDPRRALTEEAPMTDG